jgi:hypothetical protein
MSWRQVAWAASLLIFASIPAFVKTPSTKWKTVETLSYSWCAVAMPFEFVLSIPVDHDSEGDFTRLQVVKGGTVVLAINDEDGMAKYSQEIPDGPMREQCAKNLLASEHLLMLPSVKGRSDCPILMMFGCSYASSPGSLHVIALGDARVPREILRLRNFSLAEVKDLDSDGVPEIIGKECFSQSMAPGIFTYDPYSVYRFGAHAGSPMKLDVALSKRFNETNYYGWAGIKCREDIAVVLTPPGGGRPVLMDAAKAQALVK